jgi:hypothetical protein
MDSLEDVGHILLYVDGHNWMYPVALGVIDSETTENWVWFMERLKQAIGTPPGMTFSTKMLDKQ